MKVPVLAKSIFQVRYAAKLSNFELLIPASIKFTDYPHWSTDKISVTLKNFENHCSLTIKHDNFTYEQDSSDTEIENKNILDAITILPNELKFESFQRIGYRRKYFIPVTQTFESLVSILNIKLLSQKSELAEIFPEQVRDLYYRVDFDDVENENKYHVFIGPCTRNELSEQLEFNKGSHLDPKSANLDYLSIVEKFPETSVYMDIDIFHLGEIVGIEHIRSFYEEINKEFDNISSKLNSYLFSKIIRK